MKRLLMQFLQSLAFILISVWVLLSLLLYIFQPGFVYYPLAGLAATPGQAGLAYEDVILTGAGGVSLHGWLKRPDDWRAGDRYPLVVVYGGVRREISEFVARSGAAGKWGWLMVNYRGFGLSQGEPSERAVLDDARHIYDWAAARPDVDAGSIVVLGRSLGSYVAVAVAAQRPARAVILATPFDSFVALGEKHFPQLPLSWIFGGRFDPSALAPAIEAPALFLLAENDEVTPADNGRALARRWGGWTQTVLLPGASHYRIERREDFWRSVRGFLAALTTSAARG